ncbi:MAG TPA: WHG domain-containing protein [Acidimicrobiia bacterium]|nr:WHG domain-containing protein [Acidimicrobiia bacterium]
MARKAGLSRNDVVDVAAVIADSEGLEATSLGAVARRLGVRTPSLYSHVDGVDGLRRELALRGAALLTGSIATAMQGKSGRGALRDAARANREFASRHPGLYQTFTPAPREEDDPELYSAMAEPVWELARVLVEMGVDEGSAVHLIRAFRSMLHGFIVLEAADGFGMPVDVDASFDAAVDLVIDGIEARALRG